MTPLFRVLYYRYIRRQLQRDDCRTQALSFRVLTLLAVRTHYTTMDRVKKSMPKPDTYTQIAETLQLVPEGRVVSYGQLADLAGLPGRARLVGRCLRLADPDVPLPWHRVVRADGKIAFDAGSEEAEAQRHNLLAEGVSVINNRIKMSVYCWQPDTYTLLYRLRR